MSNSIAKKSIVLAALTTAITFACALTPATADVIVTDATGTATATSWGVLPGENSGGGSATITGTAPRSGSGSIELRGDRSRLQIGNQYSAATSNLMSLGDVTGLAFDWRIAANSSNPYNPDFTPSLRLLVQDGSQRSELVWQGAYNNTYGNTARDTWYSSSFADNFFQVRAGSGVTLDNGSQINKSVSSWISDNYSTAAFVSAISVGTDSGSSTSYHAFADNVVLGTKSGNTTYNFEVTPTPEPSTYAMMALGLVALCVLGAKRKKDGLAL